VNEKDEVIRRKLDIVLADDLEAIIEDVAKEALLDKPYFKIVEYKEYDEAVYSRRAIVEFFFFKSISVKITRKYRYIRKTGIWDRYYNKYYMVFPEANETEN
jgi:hypothetical protein